MPERSIDQISRFVPTFRAAFVYGTSDTPASNPEWYATKFMSG